MEKRGRPLSRSQILLYRPDGKAQTADLSFAEQLALLPAATPTQELVKLALPLLPESDCTTDGVEYLSHELGLKPTSLRAPQILLLLSLIEENGGGKNSGRLVLNVPAAEKVVQKRSSKRRKLCRLWTEYGYEPKEISLQRIGVGVGGGISQLNICDFKRPTLKQQAAAQWMMATTGTLAS